MADPVPAPDRDLAPTTERAPTSAPDRDPAPSRGAPGAREGAVGERFDGVWMPRRDLFSKLTWLAVLSAVTAAVVAAFRMLFPKVFFEPPMTFRAGSPSDYQPGTVSERWKKDWRVWIVRSDKGLFALSASCTHLGCTPVWMEAENRFHCPCHGSVYTPEGVNLEGPAPRPLERFRVSLDRQGHIVVDKRRVFRREWGEWNHPDSLLRL